MHELIREFVRDAPHPHALVRLPLDDGALVALFCPAGAEPEAPRWIAKTARGDLPRRRLRAEARALGQLEAVAFSLGVPRLLGWSPGSASGTACLLQSGLSGRPATSLGWLRHTRPEQVPAGLRQAGAWLARFQREIKPPQSLTLEQLALAAVAQAEADRQSHSQYAGLLLPVAALIQELAPRTEASSVFAVAAHGDFWAGNILVPGPTKGSASSLRVMDWAGFRPASALEDIFVWLAALRAAGGREQGLLARWRQSFFTPGAIQHFLQGWATTAGYSELLSRLSFYLFVFWRMRWELGLDLQTRDENERRQAEREWREAVSWLARQRFPDPFLPAAA